jgi:hypothetical protein
MTDEDFTGNGVSADLVDYVVHEIPADSREINPAFEYLSSWVNMYLGPGTAELHGVEGIAHPAIKDENRNAIVPGCSTEIDGRTYWLSIKGCGAQEDMFFGGEFTREKIAAACHDPALLPKVRGLHEPVRGFIMSETWMGESPYGAQGEDNARDGFEFSALCNGNGMSINGAYICPTIALVPLAGPIEDAAKQFYWFRPHPGRYYQELRLVPSNTRLYFESPHVLSADPDATFELLGVTTPRAAQRFEINFIRSGIAILSLFARSCRVRDGGGLEGLAFHDVWFDKDAIVAPDGTIHFADIEGLQWHQIPADRFSEVQRHDWDELAFEFLYALIRVDSHRAALEGIHVPWPKQRESISTFLHIALDRDPFAYPRLSGNDLNVVVENTAIDGAGPVEIPFLAGVGS